MTPDKIIEIVERFERNIDVYRSSSYNETELRVEFINPFWKELGWDVDNESGYAHIYRDVVHEEPISSGGGSKVPDYCFRVGGMRKFFLEAKRPGLNIKEDAAAAHQLRRYAWSSKLPISILTNFEELSIYDGRLRPHASDKASKARISYFTYKDYVSKWDDIAGVFARESVLKGSFDKYAVAVNGRRGTSEVDAEFLSEIEEWRDLLADEIAARNPELGARDLNYAVQTTIDRIVFLRMCEDRNIELHGQLQALCAGPRIYPRLLEIFEKADDKFNSGLFHFRIEPGRPGEPDNLTPKLDIRDAPLKHIISRLYYPESPYEFGVIPAEILGNVYERFLGKVIRIDEGKQRAIVEEKPEVRKAGGVYYTPQYIVNHIVAKSLGKLCERKSPAEISKLRILDPACGSGSFLLGAYQFLLDYHLKWYLEKKETTGKIPSSPSTATRKKAGSRQAIYEARKNEWRLSSSEKKRILLNNIYGVDIDAQAVEVTKLSLLLKVLEDESFETLRAQLAMWRERALPDLAGNIKCGNSLIGPDFYCNGQLSLFNEEEIYRINVFDWNDPVYGFGRIMKSGGFDCVIGNPPYVRIQAMKEWAPFEVEHYKKTYRSAGSGNFDIYAVFVEKGLSLLNPKGRLGYILPHKFFNSRYGAPLRGILADGKHLSEVIHFGDQQVFNGSTTYTCLLFLEKTGTSSMRFNVVDDIVEWSETGKTRNGLIRADKISDAEWNFIVGDGKRLFNKLSKMPVKLGDIANIFVGTQTSADDIFVLENCKEQKKHVSGFSRSLNENVKIERDLTKPFLFGRQIRRYDPLVTDSRLVCPYEINETGCRLYSEQELTSEYPLAWDYLKRNKKNLQKRENGKFKGKPWHAFGYPKSMPLFDKTKIVVPDYNDEPSFTFDTSASFFKTGYGIILKDESLSPLYLLGLLNSKLLFHHLKSIGTSLRGGYIRFWTQFLEKLPVRQINFNNDEDKKAHDTIVSLVKTMLDLRIKIINSKTPDEIIRVERLATATDSRIDSLVFKLYEIADADIRIIEKD
ncbi:MAG TPA: Eco57I restriction-modification methylase domain-containing protein [bacterium]|nr:Eco57I restriction-modification methylase domain-containing protein [bacterium]